MSEEVILTQRKKKREQTKYPFFKPKITESEVQTDNQGGTQQKEVYSIYGIREQNDKARMQLDMQRHLMEQDLERMREENYNKRIALYNQTKSELSNMVKAVLADQTIKYGKGKHTTRQHRKIAWGLIHRDSEESCEIELRRSGAEGND